MLSNLILLFLLISTYAETQILSNASITPHSVIQKKEILYDNAFIGSIFAVFIVSIITVVAGIGGGGIYTPFFLIVLKLDLKYAIPLSSIIITTACFIRILFYINMKHPKFQKRYLIDYVPITIMIPFIGITSFMGVIITMYTPKILNFICIILIIGYTLVETSLKAIKMYKKENQQSQTNTHLDIAQDGISLEITSDEMEIMLNEEKKGDSWQTISINGLLILFSVGIISIFTYTRPLLIKCSLMYWLHYIIQIIVLFLWGSLIIGYNVFNYKRKIRNNYKFLEGDLKCDYRTSYIFGAVASLIGMITTYLGFGGGSLTSYLMVKFKMYPQVIIATASVLNFFSSIVSAFQYMITGRIIWKYAIIYIAVSIIGTIFGIIMNNKVMAYVSRQSYLVGALAFVFLISLILLIINSYEQIKHIDISIPMCKY